MGSTQKNTYCQNIRNGKTNSINKINNTYHPKALAKMNTASPTSRGANWMLMVGLRLSMIPTKMKTKRASATISARNKWPLGMKGSGTVMKIAAVEGAK